MENFLKSFSEATVTYTLGDIVAILIAGVTLVAWAVRVEVNQANDRKALEEFKIEQSEKEKNLKGDAARKEDAVWDKFRAVEETTSQQFKTLNEGMQKILVAVSRVEGKIGIKDT